MDQIENELGDAVRRLRKGLNESQEAFAVRMNTSRKTITRYETAQPPRGAALAKLALVARDAGKPYLAQVFESGLSAETQNLAEVVAVDSAKDSLNALYLNLGDEWLADQIRNFLTSARRGARIRHPLVIKGDRTGLDREIQLGIWEHHLVKARLRAGQLPQDAIDMFAREYRDDMGVTEEQALAYTQIKFPDLWREAVSPEAGGASGQVPAPTSDEISNKGSRK
jgi:transcriptional regulator with XRE-family HTH domain